MAVTETPPETVEAATEAAPAAPRRQPTGFAAVLGTGDHKVVGRLYIVSGLVFGLGALVLGGLFAVEALDSSSLDVFARDTAFQFFTLSRVGSLFLLAFPLVIGIAMVVVPLQVGARSVAFPRAAAVSYWAWLMGAVLLVASYAINGGPGGGRSTGVNLWIASMGLLVLSILLAAICLATTVLAARTTGLRLSYLPLYSWSVLVAAVMWLFTLPVLFGQLVLLYVDHRHGGRTFGGDSNIYGSIAWVLRNPQVYVIAVPVLGFAADAMATTARTRMGLRPIAQAAIGAFGILGFGAFLQAADKTAIETPVVIGMSLAAVLPILVILAVGGDLFRRGTLRSSTGMVYAGASLLVLLLGVAAGALGSIPALETAGTIFDSGVSHAVILAAVIASLGGLHWWATKIGRQPATDVLGGLAALVMLLGSVTVVVPDLISGIAGDGAELRPDWTGGIEALNVIVLIGVVIVAGGVALALVSLLPLLRRGQDVDRDPWQGQTLEWLTPSPPPLANFDTELPLVVSPEPLVDASEEK